MSNIINSKKGVILLHLSYKIKVLNSILYYWDPKLYSSNFSAQKSWELESPAKLHVK
jgi:hypothetical protein